MSESSVLVGWRCVCVLLCPLSREIPEDRTMSDPSRLHPPGPAQRGSVRVWLNEGKKGPLGGGCGQCCRGLPSPVTSMASSLGGGAGCQRHRLVSCDLVMIFPSVKCGLSR